MKTTAALFFCLTALCPPVCRAASPEAALTDAIRAYDRAGTIQISLTARASTAKGATLTTITAQIINRPGGLMAHERIVVTSNSPTFLQDTNGSGTQLYLYDGQTLYTVSAAQKTYTTERDTKVARFSELFSVVLLRYLAQGGTLTVARPARLNGEPVTLIEGHGHGLVLRAVVSNRSHALRTLALTNASKHNATTFTVTRLRLNAPLPPGLSWKPPADYVTPPLVQGTPGG